MKYVGLAMLVYLAMVLQIGARSGLSFDGVSPDFLMLSLTLLVISLKDRGAVLGAAVIGLLADCLSGGPVGISMFAAIVAVFACRRLFRRWSEYSLPTSTAICFLLTFFILIISTLAHNLIGAASVDWLGLMRLTASTSTYTALLFAALRALHGVASRLLRRIAGTSARVPQTTTGRRPIHL